MCSTPPLDPGRCFALTPYLIPITHKQTIQHLDRIVNDLTHDRHLDYDVHMQYTIKGTFSFEIEVPDETTPEAIDCALTACATGESDVLDDLVLANCRGFDVSPNGYVQKKVAKFAIDANGQFSPDWP